MGIMGLAMAQNAKKAGFPVLAYNRSNRRRDLAQQAGLDLLDSPKAVADKSDAVIVMVTDPNAVRDVLMSKMGVLSGEVKGKTLIQMSTIDEKSTLEVSELAKAREMSFLDCPVAGSKKQVEAGQLILLAGGDEDLVEAWKSLLLTMGKAVVHAGEVGKGTALKLCMNLIVAQMTTALCESVALAKVQSVDPEKIFEVLQHSPALNCGYFQIKEKPLLEEDFSPAFSLDNMLKDVRFMDQAAKEKRLMLPVIQAVRFLMEGAVSEGMGEEDLSGMVRILKPKINPN